MRDLVTQQIMELHTRLRIRMAELGFTGTGGSNVVHHLAEIAALSRDFADQLFLCFLSFRPHMQRRWQAWLPTSSGISRRSEIPFRIWNRISQSC